MQLKRYSFVLVVLALCSTVKAAPSPAEKLQAQQAIFKSYPSAHNWLQEVQGKGSNLVLYVTPAEFASGKPMTGCNDMLIFEQPLTNTSRLEVFRVCGNLANRINETSKYRFLAKQLKTK